MLVRNCAGGIVFSGDKVLLIKGADGDWQLPKGIVRSGDLANEVVLRKIRDEVGITSEIVSVSGQTHYEISSVSRVKPICNRITWYILRSQNVELENTSDPDKTDTCFFDLDHAMNLVTNNQDRAILNLSFKQFKQLA
ncbi:MAG: hydrolase [Clostridiales bacterium]|jgi:ADP-ribose pyrophosphatase YjhB (NUDIX family)|nr:hydrolase [Clostridiales bacterium]